MSERRGSDYSAYMQSEDWRERRREWYSGGWYRCVCCWRHGRLELHHVTYRRLGRELDKDLLPLCRGCHDKVSDWIRENRAPNSPLATLLAIRSVAVIGNRELSRRLKSTRELQLKSTAARRLRRKE